MRGDHPALLTDSLFIIIWGLPAEVNAARNPPHVLRIVRGSVERLVGQPVRLDVLLAWNVVHGDPGEGLHPLDGFPMISDKIGIADSVYPVDLADEKLRVGEDCQAVRAARLARGQAKRREKRLVFRDVVRRPPEEEGLGRKPLAVLFEKDPRASGSRVSARGPVDPGDQLAGFRPLLRLARRRHRHGLEPISRLDQEFLDRRAGKVRVLLNEEVDVQAGGEAAKERSRS